MKRTITIQAQNRKSREVASHEVQADVFGPLAVHRNYG